MEKLYSYLKNLWEILNLWIMDYYKDLKMQEKNIILSPPATPDLNDTNSNSNDYKVSGIFLYIF